MKPRTVMLGAIAIAMVSGMAGYLVGSNRSARSKSAGLEPPQGVSAARFPSSVDMRNGQEKADPKEIRAGLDRESDPLKRFNLALKNLEAWMKADPAGALAWLQSQQPSQRRNEVIRMALEQFSENDPKGASQWALDHLTGAELNNALIRIAQAWAERDGLEAATWLAALPVTRERDAAMENMFFTWASQDPAAALAFIQRNPGSDTLSATLRYAAYAGWAKSDPLNATAASLVSSRSNKDPAQFANTIANWATMDLEASSQWLLANVKDAAERAPAVTELASIYANQSPDAGLAWIGKLNAGPERDSAVNALAAEWATADPAAAANWAAGQTSDNLTDDSVSQILHCFLARDAKAFDTWRATLPQGPLKEQAAKVGVAAEDK